MKTQGIKVTATLLLAMLLTAGLNAQARGGRGMGPCGQGDGPAGEGYGQGKGQAGMNMAARLDLSEEQQTQLDALRLEHYKTMKPLRNEMAEIQLQKKNLMTEDDADLKAINKVIDKQTDLDNKIQKLRAEHRVQMRSLLTEEQRMRLDQSRGRRGGPGNAGQLGGGRKGGGRG